MLGSKFLSFGYSKSKRNTKSGTRKEDLLFKKEDLQKMNVLRRLIAPMGNMEAIEFLIGKLRETKNNAEFFDSMNKSV